MVCEPGSFLDAKQRQPSTESYWGNIQTGRIFGSMKTTYRYRCHGRLANYTLKTWLYRQKCTFSEFAGCALAGAKAEKFSSTWSKRSISMTVPESLKTNWEFHSALYWSLSFKVTNYLMKGPVFEILKNRLLIEHISNSVFSLSFKPSTVWGPSQTFSNPDPWRAPPCATSLSRLLCPSRPSAGGYLLLPGNAPHLGTPQPKFILRL